MNEFAVLQTLRDEVAEPAPARLAPAYARLARAMREAAGAQGAAPAPDPAAALPAPVPATAHAANRRLRRRTVWSLGAVGGVLALSLIGGNVAMAVESARAGELLREIAGTTVSFRDPAPGPGEYLLAHTRADWGEFRPDPSDPDRVERRTNVQTIDVYMPAESGADWVLVRDWGDQEAISAPEGSGQHVETLTAPNGAFYAGAGDPDPDPVGPEPGWLSTPIDEIPLGTGAEVLAAIDAEYRGGSVSRDEANFVFIADALRSGLIPAEQRAALLAALAEIPGVTSTTGVANLDGRVGVAIGRAEPLRFDERQELIIDPDTGLVIGERTVTGLAVFGLGANEVVSLTAIETSVAATAPRP